MGRYLPHGREKIHLHGSSYIKRRPLPERQITIQIWVGGDAAVLKFVEIDLFAD